MAKTFSVEIVGYDDRQPGESGAPERSLQNTINYLRGILGGQHNAAVTVKCRNNLVKASGTATFAALANNDTVTVNGKVLTAKTSGAVAANHEFNLGGSDTNAATNCAALVNASTDALLSGIVTASSSGAVVTFSAAQPGVTGNAISLASSNGVRAAVSAAKLANGAETAISFTF